jgi:hypothetical protein
MKPHNLKIINELREIIKNHYGGTVLLLIMLILAGVLVVTLAAGEIVRTGLIMSRTQVHSTKAYYAAEAGAERILWEIRENGIFSGITCDNPGVFCFNIEKDGLINECVDSGCTYFDKQELSNESFYQIEYEYNDPVTKLTCFGNFEEIRRVVELKY